MSRLPNALWLLFEARTVTHKVIIMGPRLKAILAEASKYVEDFNFNFVQKGSRYNMFLAYFWSKNEQNKKET